MKSFEDLKKLFLSKLKDSEFFNAHQKFIFIFSLCLFLFAFGDVRFYIGGLVFKMNFLIFNLIMFSVFIISYEYRNIISSVKKIYNLSKSKPVSTDEKKSSVDLKKDSKKV